jgi:hypothetical protein
MSRRVLILLPLLVLAACSGKPKTGVVKVDGPSFEPRRVNIQTLEPAPPPTPTPKPTATPKPTPTPTPVPPPRTATLRAASGVQRGDVGSYCWSDQVGGPSECFSNEPPTQPRALPVKAGEKVLLALDATIPPNDESIRPFQGSRSGYPNQQIEPALETELTVDLPKGEWSMDLCATWHGRGQPICWLFKVDVR